MFDCGSVVFMITAWLLFVHSLTETCLLVLLSLTHALSYCKIIENTSRLLEEEIKALACIFCALILSLFF